MITVDNQTETIFVYSEDLVTTRINESRELETNEFVRFEIWEGKDGKTKAINVKRLHVGIFSANDIFEYHSTNEHTEAGKRAEEWLDSTLNPGEFVRYTESSYGERDDGIPFIEDYWDANNYPIEEILEFLGGVEPEEETKELVSTLVEFKLALEQGPYPSFPVQDFSTILSAMDRALEAYPNRKAEFERFLEENEKMIRYQVTYEFEDMCGQAGEILGYYVNPKDNGKYYQLLVDHLLDSPRSEWAQRRLLASVDEFKESYWDDVDLADPWIEYIREKYARISCCIMALEFVEVVDFDRPGGEIEGSLDLVDFGSEVELVGKYDIQAVSESDKILVTENGLTVLEDYRKRGIGSGLVKEAEAFIKSKFETRWGVTKICFLTQCDNKKSSELFQKLGYTLVTKESASVQAGNVSLYPADPADELDEYWLKETTV